MIGKLQHWIEGRVGFGGNIKGVRTHYWVTGQIRAALSCLFSCCLSPCSTISYKYNHKTFYLNKRSCVRWINQHSSIECPRVKLTDSDQYIRSMLERISSQANQSRVANQPIPTIQVGGVQSPSASSCSNHSSRSSLEYTAKPLYGPFREALSRLDEREENPEIYREIIKVFLGEPYLLDAADAFALWKRMCCLDKEGSMISLSERLELLEQICRHHDVHSLAKKYLGKTRHAAQVEQYELNKNNPDWDVINSENGWALYQEALTLPEQLAKDTYELAAEHGSGHAKFKLAQILETKGQGAEAFDAYQTAAMEGFRPAQLKVSQCYREGIKVPKDLRRAAAWTALAKCAFNYE